MWTAGVDFCSRPAIQTFSKDGGHAGNYRTIKGKASTSFYSPPAASFHQQRVDPTCNCGISCTMSERCATPSAGMTDVYDVIPLLVMRRISFAETIWEFFHAPSHSSPNPPLSHHHLSSLSWASTSRGDRRKPPVTASRQPHELLGTAIRPHSPEDNAGKETNGKRLRCINKNQEKNVRCPETRQGGKNTMGRVCSEFFFSLFSIIVTFVLKF